MAHRRVIHFPGAIYFVSATARYEQSIFADDSDRAALSELVARVSAHCAAQIHAFCWLDIQILMVLQVHDISLSHVMRRIAAQHARRFNQKVGYKGSLFRHSHRAELLSDNVSLLNAVAAIHLSPVAARQAAHAAEYPWSSRRAYLGLEEIPWLTTQTVRAQLAAILRVHRIGDGTCLGWEHIWSQGLRAPSGNSPGTPSGRPDEIFRAWLKGRSAMQAQPASLDQLIHAVSRWLLVEPAAIESPGRRPLPSFARALIVATATENGIAKLSELARRFGRGRSTLHESREAYRARVPGLFNIPLAEILQGPAAPASEVVRLLSSAAGRPRRSRSG